MSYDVWVVSDEDEDEDEDVSCELWVVTYGL